MLIKLYVIWLIDQEMLENNNIVSAFKLMFR